MDTFSADPPHQHPTDPPPIFRFRPVVAPITLEAPLMAGTVSVYLDGPLPDRDRAQADAAATLEQIRTQVAALSRFREESALSVLNHDPRAEVEVGPLLGTLLVAARAAVILSGGLVDPTLLDQFGVPLGQPVDPDERSRQWRLVPRDNGGYIVHRPPGLAFDLGGIAKGWIADRALERLSAYEMAFIDAGGDMAITVANGHFWEVGVLNQGAPGVARDPAPTRISGQIGVLNPGAPGLTRYLWRLGAPVGVRRIWGLGVSGTSERNWLAEGALRHALIDPRTGKPSWSDLSEVTVLTSSALRADILAKTAVIGGRRDGLALLERAGIDGAVAIGERGTPIVLPASPGAAAS